MVRTDRTGWRVRTQAADRGDAADRCRCLLAVRDESPDPDPTVRRPGAARGGAGFRFPDGVDGSWRAGWRPHTRIRPGHGVRSPAAVLDCAHLGGRAAGVLSVACLPALAGHPLRGRLLPDLLRGRS